MSDPVTMGLVGAGIGAMANKSDPLMGAAMGGLGGYILGPTMAGSQTATGAAAGIPAASEQAAMLAAQTGEFGTAGLNATNAAAGYAKGATGLASNGGLLSSMSEKPLGFGPTRGQMVTQGGKMMMGQPGQQQPAPAARPTGYSSANVRPMTSVSPYQPTQPGMQPGMPAGMPTGMPAGMKPPMGIPSTAGMQPTMAQPAVPFMANPASLQKTQQTGTTPMSMLAFPQFYG